MKITKMLSNLVLKWRGVGTRGNTLMEILLSSTMLGAVAISFGTIYGVANHHMIQETNSFLSQNDASFAMEHMKRHLMGAVALADPNVAPGFDSAGRPIDNYPVNRIDPSGNKVLTAAVNFYAGSLGVKRWQRYEVKGGELNYYSDWVGAPNPPEVICRGVTDPDLFHRPLASEVQIVLKVQKGGSSSFLSSTLETTVNLRAIPVNNS